MSEKHTCEACGHEQKSGSIPRSLPQIRRYHKLIASAYHHWPETHDHQFSSVHEFRKWAEMKAGHRVVGAQIPLTGMSKERAMLLAEAAIRGAGSYAMPIIHGDTLVIFRPKSVSFGKMAHSDFCALSDGVEAVIRAETGLDPDQLLTERAS